MAFARELLLPRQRHLKWPALDWLEVTLMVMCGITLIGAAVATRRNDHLYLTALSESLHGHTRQLVDTIIRTVVLGVALCMVYFGYLNFLRGFGSFRMPSLTPIASLYAAIPLSGLLIALFTIEQLVNGWRNGFDHPPDPFEDRDAGRAGIEQIGGRI